MMVDTYSPIELLADFLQSRPLRKCRETVTRQLAGTQVRIWSMAPLQPASARLGVGSLDVLQIKKTDLLKPSISFKIKAYIFESY